MTWLVIAIAAYATFGFVAVGDRYLLSGPLPNHKVYTFYIGLLGMLIFLLTPFFGLSFLAPGQFVVALLSGLALTAALFFFYYGLRSFEATRMVPATGGLVPIFTLLLSLVLFSGQGALAPLDFIAFILLIVGSIVITVGSDKKVSFQSFKIALIAAFLFAISFVLAKYVYLTEPFWSSFVWMRVGGFLFAIGLFAVSSELRKALFAHKQRTEKKRIRTAILFLGNQGLGAGAGVLEGFAIFLAPPLYIAFVNALHGVQYIFLMLFAAIVSFLFPAAIHEIFSGRALVQKIVATVLIMVGISVLALSN